MAKLYELLQGEYFDRKGKLYVKGDLIHEGSLQDTASLEKKGVIKEAKGEKVEKMDALKKAYDKADAEVKKAYADWKEKSEGEDTKAIDTAKKAYDKALEVFNKAKEALNINFNIGLFSEKISIVGSNNTNMNSKKSIIITVLRKNLKKNQKK